MSNKRENVGKTSRDLILKDKKITHSAKEQTDEQLTDYEKNIYECIERSKKDFNGDFFIVVATKKEKLMPNVIRNYFYGRKSCPTPNYDQVLYKYHRKSDKLDFLWVIPDRQVAKDMIAQQQLVEPHLWGVLRFVLKFADGTLFKLAKELNGEKEKTPELKDKHGK